MLEPIVGTAGRDAGPVDASVRDVAKSIACGVTTCSSACCPDEAGGTCAARSSYCISSAGGEHGYYENCDDPSDCATDEVCCLDVADVTLGGTDCLAASLCTNPQLKRACLTSADCGGANVRALRIERLAVRAAAHGLRAVTSARRPGPRRFSLRRSSSASFGPS